jgi:aspartate/methionine/tyrosine aminotransferase
MKPVSLTRSAVPRLKADAASQAQVLIDLSGEYSQFTVPGPVADAIVHAARTTDLGRHNTAGGKYLRHAVQQKLAEVNALEVREDAIVLTGGGTAALCYALAALCDPGESVLVPDPGPPGYARLCASWGIAPVPYPLGLDGVPDYDALEDLIGHDTKAILLNTPANPSGAVLDGVRLLELVDFARDHDLYVVSDEELDMLRFAGGPALGPAYCDTDGRVVSVFSMARTHCLAGLRLGYAVAAPPIAAAIAGAQDSQLAGPSTLALSAGLAALTMDRSVVDSMIASYVQQRDIVLAMLPPEVVPQPPAGGYYMLVDIASCGFPDSRAFAETFRQAAGVKVAPGLLFGANIPQMVRLTLAVRERALGEGVEKLAAFIAECAQ